MRNHLPAFTISMLAHAGLLVFVYSNFVNQPVTLLDKPDLVSLKLSMFVPPSPPPEPVVVAAKPIVVPEPKPVVVPAKPVVIPKPKPVVVPAKPVVVPEPKPVVAPAKPVVVPEPVVVRKPKPPPAKLIKKPRPKPKEQPISKPIVKAKPEPVVKSKIVRPPPVIAAAPPPKPVDTSIINKFRRSIRQAIEVNKRYPKKARRLRQQGTAIVAFTILRDGSIENLRITQSSGVERLDQAALKAIEKISGQFPVPNELDKSSWAFSVPIQYSLI